MAIMVKWRGRLRRGRAEDGKLWSHLEWPKTAYKTTWCLDNSSNRILFTDYAVCHWLQARKKGKKLYVFPSVYDVSCRSYYDNYLITGLDCGLDYWTELMDWIVEGRIELIICSNRTRDSWMRKIVSGTFGQLSCMPVVCIQFESECSREAFLVC